MPSTSNNNGSNQSLSDDDDEESRSGPFLVIDGYYAIDRVVAWRGEKNKREYKIRFLGGDENWLPPGDLCDYALREAHALVRADKIKAARERRAAKAKDKKLPPVVSVTKSPPSEPAAHEKPKTKTSNKDDQRVEIVAKNSQSPELSVNDDSVQIVYPTSAAASARATEERPKKRVKAAAKLSKPPDLSADDAYVQVLKRPSAVARTKATKERPKKPKEPPGSRVTCIEVTDLGRQIYGDILTSASQPEDEDKKPKAKRKRSQDKKRNATIELEPMSEEWKRRELPRGNDVSLVNFEPVERIDVNGENVRDRVSAARINGIPIVLTGHDCWPEFAPRWLKAVSKDEKVDLTKPNEVDVESLIADIGNEHVSVVEKNYSENNPTRSSMKASVFLNKFWPGGRNYKERKEQLYMQQWQYPTQAESKSAKKALCGTDNLPPKQALFEDLLPCWMKGDKDNPGNPYQYIFMGDSGTRTKLHNDPGGLDILIAPIVGEKECVLCHRDDRDQIYGVKSQLDAVDLNRYPMTAFARVWKTVVKPGEILVMPHDTYHMVRNLTPCLSYHRLHLDAINLKGFLASMFRGDAIEIDHCEVIWNVSSEILDRLKEDLVQYNANDRTEGGTRDDATIGETARLLGLLRSACVELKLVRELPHANKYKGLKYDSHTWQKLVNDIDLVLHDYRYRDDDKKPRFRFAVFDSAVEAAARSEIEDPGESSDEEQKREFNGKFRLDDFFQNLNDLIEELPFLTRHDEDRVISDSLVLNVGDKVHIRLFDRLACATVDSKVEKKAAFITYDGLPSCFDEFLPFEQVRGISSEPHVVATALRPNICKSSGFPLEVSCAPLVTPGQPRKAHVLSTRTGTLYMVKISLGTNSILERWIPRDAVVRKLGAR